MELTITTNKPSICTLDASGSQIVVAFSEDFDQIGRYLNIVITADVDDFDFAPATISFNLDVIGCPISAFTSSPANLGTFVYTLGEPTTLFGAYTITQVDDCGYPVT